MPITQVKVRRNERDWRQSWRRRPERQARLAVLRSNASSVIRRRSCSAATGGGADLAAPAVSWNRWINITAASTLGAVPRDARLRASSAVTSGLPAAAARDSRLRPRRHVRLNPGATHLHRRATIAAQVMFVSAGEPSRTADQQRARHQIVTAAPGVIAVLPASTGQEWRRDSACTASRDGAAVVASTDSGPDSNGVTARWRLRRWSRRARWQRR